MAVHFPSIRITSGPSVEMDRKENTDNGKSEELQEKTSLLEQSIQKRIQSNAARQAVQNRRTVESEKENVSVEDNALTSGRENNIIHDSRASQEALKKDSVNSGCQLMKANSAMRGIV